MNDEYTPEEVIGSLAYRFQTLRCWIINELINGSFYDEHTWADLQERAQKVLKETE